MVTITTIAEIHRWRRIHDESAPEGFLVELLEDDPSQSLLVFPTTRGRYLIGGWMREDGSSFQDERLICWRHIIPELTKRFKEQYLLSPDTTLLEAYCVACKANDREMSEVRALLYQEEPSR